MASWGVGQWSIFRPMHRCEAFCADLFKKIDFVRVSCVCVCCVCVCVCVCVCACAVCAYVRKWTFSHHPCTHLSIILCFQERERERERERRNVVNFVFMSTGVL